MSDVNQRYEHLYAFPGMNTIKHSRMEIVGKPYLPGVRS